MQTRYSREDLLSEHPYAAPYTLCGQTMHGGFDAAGHYISPRTALRIPAIAAWEDQLLKRGQSMVDVPRRLYAVRNAPNVEQQAYLISQGLYRPFYDALTTMAEIETKAGRLCKMQALDFSLVLHDDVADLAIGHLNKGLLEAHGMDEGGDPGDPERGGHDRLWLHARDLLFPDGIAADDPPLSYEAKTESGLLERQFEDIPLEFELSLRFFMTILLNEARADLFFEFCRNLLSKRDVFPCPSENVRLASDIVSRIEQDEATHVGYLRVMFSELRASRWQGADGQAIVDALIDEITDRQLALEHEAAEQRDRAIAAHIAAACAQGKPVSLDRYRQLEVA